MKLFMKNNFGIITITNEAGDTIATFSSGHDGNLAFGWFVGGVARIHPDSNSAGTTLYDTDLNQYMVGDLSDLVA